MLIGTNSNRDVSISVVTQMPPQVMLDMLSSSIGMLYQDYQSRRSATSMEEFSVFWDRAGKIALSAANLSLVGEVTKIPGIIGIVPDIDPNCGNSEGTDTK